MMSYQRQLLVVGQMMASPEKDTPWEGDVIREALAHHMRVPMKAYSAGEFAKVTDDECGAAAWKDRLSYVLVIPAAHKVTAPWHDVLWRRIERYFDWSRLVIVHRGHGESDAGWLVRDAVRGEPVRLQQFDITAKTTRSAPAGLASFLWSLRWLYVPCGQDRLPQPPPSAFSVKPPEKGGVHAATRAVSSR